MSEFAPTREWFWKIVNGTKRYRAPQRWRWQSAACGRLWG
jgi:hypothetical protein